VYGNAQVSGNAGVYRNAWVYGDAQVSGNAHVYGNARIKVKSHVFCTSSLKYNITVTPQNIQIGCFNYTHKQWTKTYKKIAKKEGLSSKEVKYIKKVCLLGIEIVTKYA
jgi:hypothetical protein